MAIAAGFCLFSATANSHNVAKPWPDDGVAASFARTAAAGAGAGSGGAITGAGEGAGSGDSCAPGRRTGLLDRCAIVQSNSSAALLPVYSANTAVMPHGLGVASARAYNGL